MSTHGLPGAYSPPRYYSTVPEDEEVPSGQATSAYAPSPGLRRSWGVSTSTAAAASTASLPPVGQGYYLYYRLFTLDGALTVNTTFDPHDPLVGRIKTSSVAPPHYPLSLKRRLGEAEGLLDPQGLRMQLYPLASSLEVFAEGFVVGKLGTDVGATPDTAVALVMIDSRPIRDQAGRVPTMTQHVGKYIYYTLHMPAGSIHSYCAFDPSEPQLGRIDRRLIAPPRNVQSLKRCIARTEGKPACAYWDAYPDGSGELWTAERSINPELEAPIGSPPPVGTVPQMPFLLVQPPREYTRLNRALCAITPQRRAAVELWGPFFFILAKIFPEILTKPPLGIPVSQWLAVSEGDVLMTDGYVWKKTRREKIRGSDLVDAYKCCRVSDGKIGWVMTAGTQFLEPQ